MLFKDFVLGNIPLNGDTNSNYHILKYFFDNVLQNTIPLWDPYTYLGRHFIYVLSSCALNPFAWSIPVLHLLGLDFYQAYIWFIVGYYFFGCFGFYRLIREILTDDLTAFLGFATLLFSGMGAMLFNQVLIVYMFVPTVWLMVFMVRFFRSFKPQEFLFCIFSGMVLCVSCFPFYFLTYILVVNLFFVLIFPDRWLDCFHGTKEFIVRHRWILVGGMCAVAVTALPMFVFKVLDSQGDISFPGRHRCHIEDVKNCVEGGSLNYGEIAFFGSLGERMSGGMLFKNLDKQDYNSDDFIYIPIVCYFLILLAFLTRFDRLRLFVLAVGATVFLIGLGGVTPVHGFLYERISYFGLFRNLYFFVAFLIPLIIFFGTLQFKSLMDANNKFSRGIAGSILAVSVLGMLALLAYQRQVLTVSYVSVFLFAFLGWTVIRGYFSRYAVHLTLLLLFAVVIEPWYVFASYQNHVPPYQCSFPKDSYKPEFSFDRTSSANAFPQCLPYAWQVYSALRYSAAMKDFSEPFDFFPDTLARPVFNLFITLPTPLIWEYSSRKILVVDHVRLLDQEGGLNDFTDALKSSANTAYVSDMSGELSGLTMPAKQHLPTAFIPGSKSAEVKVVQFNPNRLVMKTSFEADKFLVYNDAYTSDWKVFFDGRPVRLYRANMAFKGVFVSKGDHTIDFRYQPPGGVWVYWLVMIVMMAVPIAGLGMVLRNKVKFPYES